MLRRALPKAAHSASHAARCWVVLTSARRGGEPQAPSTDRASPRRPLHDYRLPQPTMGFPSFRISRESLSAEMPIWLNTISAMLAYGAPLRLCSLSCYLPAVLQHARCTIPYRFLRAICPAIFTPSKYLLSCGCLFPSPPALRGEHLRHPAYLRLQLRCVRCFCCSHCFITLLCTHRKALDRTLSVLML